MSVAASDVTDRAKEFASLDDAEIDLAIADAELQINADLFGDKTDLATVYLAAHILTLSNPTLATPVAAVQSETVGQVSRSYAVAASSSPDHLDSTRWGKAFKALRKQVAAWIVV